MTQTIEIQGSGTASDVPQVPLTRVVMEAPPPVQYVVRATLRQRERPALRDIEGNPEWWNWLTHAFEQSEQGEGRSWAEYIKSVGED